LLDLSRNLELNAIDRDLFHGAFLRVGNLVSLVVQPNDWGVSAVQKDLDLRASAANVNQSNVIAHDLTLDEIVRDRITRDRILVH
jgi:hypothetical protein